MLVSTRVLLISKLLYLLLESFNNINFREKITCLIQKTKLLSKFNPQNWANSGDYRCMFTSKSQNECVAENKMHHGTHLLRQHNQLKWRCYFPLCPGIFLHKPSYLSLR